MQDTITTIYCVCADLLRALEIEDDQQSRLSNAEIMMTPIVAALYFGGKIERTQEFLHEHGYIHARLSKSRLNRRLHRLPLELWRTLFDLLGQVFKEHNSDNSYTVDSMPFPVCDNIRISRCRLLQGEEHRSYCASKRRYYFGLKVHLLITGKGEPVELLLTPASVSDIKAFRALPLDLPEEATIHADRAYTDYQEEDLLLDSAGIILQSQRKANSKRPLLPWLEALARPIRQRVETTFSQIEALLPKHIHAVTPKGLILKIICFLLAVSFKAIT
jgi:hypothetical protein